MLIDAHLHLQDIQAEGVLAEILARAWDLDIHRFWCNGTHPADWPVVEKIAVVDDRVIPFFGVHPWHAEKVRPGWDKELEQFLKNRDAGVGEIGLDKAREEIDLTKQIEIFRRQLEIAIRLSKPVSIHCVKAWGDLLKVLREDLPGPVRFMIHAYHGSTETLREVLKLGAYVSFSWKWLRGGTPDMMELLRHVSADRLLLETDFPYTEPGKLDEEAGAKKYFEYLRETYRIAALAKGIEEAALEGIVWNNGTAFLSGASAR